MHLSKKSEYALRATINLGIAAEVGRGTVSGAELAEANRLPLKFVERILQELREAGVVETHRGKFGGYALAKPADEIGIGQIVRLMDGRLAPICCASENAYQPCTCPDEDHCGLRMIMIDVRNAIANILDRYTVAQVVEVTLRKMRRDGIVPPFATAESFAATGTPPKRKADPADGFLAGLSALATLTQDPNELDDH
ncbi:Rrf2 family transcriptional regulator [Luteolibacter yonseiensis]|uniref:Rrf2 family transcriptional regulator n=1 Tax=Luteolibacter yonseiensis TaxID=1144680 RepID=A0A934R5Y2_9BACT|nr:Rrf2 family transcriptional regulator [Luteolibacter yonseiensis]MBK1815845.1 Rrf2 family transcriptional regulator [Luteolibacter yonseiensis]